MKRTFTCLLSACGLLLASPSFAQVQSPPAADSSSPSYPRVTVGVLSYIQYDAELTNRDGYNGFDITRGYIDIRGLVANNIRFRFTPDVKRVTDGSLSGALGMRVKYAFVELDDVLAKGAWLRFGIHQTPWLDFEESINRYRLQGTMMAEREGIIPGSADAGVGYLVPLPGNYGEINAGVYNGEGYANAESNRFKSFQGRATFRPFPAAGLARGLRVSGFYDLGWYDEGRPRRHGIFMVSFEHEHFAGTAQWLASTARPASAAFDTDARGYSLFGEVRQGTTGWAAVGRFDRFDPNRRNQDDTDRRVIVGAAYWLTWSATRVGVFLNDENVSYDPGRGRPDENRLLLQMQVQF
jgi:hypothetical protein